MMRLGLGLSGNLFLTDGEQPNRLASGLAFLALWCVFLFRD